MIVGIVVIVFVIVIGAIIMIDIYPTNPITAFVCILLLFVASLWITRGLLLLMFLFGKR